MTFTWGCTITANILLMYGLVRSDARSRYPIFFWSQAVCLCLSMTVLIAFYAPWMAESQYESLWQFTDAACILLGAFSGWELLGRCNVRNRIACALGAVLLIHSGLSLSEYSPDIYQGPSWVRVWLNILLTIALALMSSYETKEKSYVR